MVTTVAHEPTLPPAAGAGCVSEQRPRGSDRGTGVTHADHPLNCHGSATAPGIGSCREALVVVLATMFRGLALGHAELSAVPS
jgi:hypothetical protein